MKKGTCIICGNDTKKETTKCCSNDCRSQARSLNLVGNGYAGRTHSEETKNKMVSSHATSPKKQNIIDANVGRIHTEASKLKMRKYWATVGVTDELREIRSKNIAANGNKGGKTKWYEVNGIRVQGRYELYYILNLIDEGLPLPQSHSGYVQTPYGNYLPDFEFPDKYVEIKSTYTLVKSIKSRQYKKIKWTDLNVKEVKIIVLNGAKVNEYLGNLDKNYLSSLRISKS